MLQNKPIDAPQIAYYQNNFSLNKIIDIRHLTPYSFIIRAERNGLTFSAGQYLHVGLTGDFQSREYSIYSGENDDFLEILVKEIDQGYLTPLLKKLEISQQIETYGPFGHFHLNPNGVHNRKFVFIATGTGISPFHSFVKTYGDFDYTIVHGVRSLAEQYDKNEYPKERYISCVSSSEGGDYHGRVTQYLKQSNINTEALYYLCGNSAMVMDTCQLLLAKGVARKQIFTEIYF